MEIRAWIKWARLELRCRPQHRNVAAVAPLDKVVVPGTAVKAVRVCWGSHDRWWFRRKVEAGWVGFESTH